MTPHDACSLLNGLIACDAYAVRRLFQFKVACFPCVADHPSVITDEIAGNHLVGFLGVLNGMFLEAGDEQVVVSVTDEVSGKLLRFETRWRHEVGL